MNKQKGFTLVEIAMVFIVIALLMGGILKASEMITNTRLKQIGSDQAGVLAAMNLYYDRYRQFPGDDPDASDHFTEYVAQLNANGDGDGHIGLGNDWDLDETTAQTAGEQETLKFWAHLRAAGFIEGIGSTYTRPNHTFDNGEIGIQDGSLGIREHVLIFGNLPGDYARILDAQNDENVPDMGHIRINSVLDGMTLTDVPVTTIVPEDRYHLAWRLAGS